MVALELLCLNRKKQYGSSNEQLDQLVFEQFAREFSQRDNWCAGIGRKESPVMVHMWKLRSVAWLA